MQEMQFMSRTPSKKQSFDVFILQNFALVVQWVADAIMFVGCGQITQDFDLMLRAPFDYVLAKPLVAK